MNTLSTKEALRFGWETFKKRPYMLIGGFFLAMLITMVTSSVLDTTEMEPFTGPALIMALMSFIIGVFVEMGMVTFAIRAHDNVQTVAVKDLWNPTPFVHYLVGQILTGIIVIIGLVLLIVPGIIAAIALFATSYLIIDKNRSPIEAIKESYALTKGHWMSLFVFMLAIVGINLLGLLALFVGLLVSIPVTMIAIVHMYRQLSHATHAAISEAHATH